MKKLFLLAVMALMGSVALNAQNEGDMTMSQLKQVVKERKELAKMSKKAIESKVLKDAKKQAKTLKKEGWKPAVGTLPIEKQLTDFYLRRAEPSIGLPKYLLSQNQSTSTSYTTARKAAEMRARVGLGTMMGAEVSELAEDSGNDVGMGPGDQEAVRKFVDESKQLMQQSIGRTEVIIDMYREINGRTDVWVGLSYDGKRARADILKAFENESAELKGKLSKLLGE